MTLIRLGYWSCEHDPDWPDVHDFVDESWSEDDRFEVDLHLSHAMVARRYMGKSTCRLCSRLVGSLEFSDGVYIWPEGLAHYVTEHSVRLPQPFVDHVRQVQDRFDDSLVDEDWWRSHRSWGG